MTEKQADFHAVAQQRYAQLVATGQAIAWADMRRYLQERVRERAIGKPAAKPKARQLGALLLQQNFTAADFRQVK